STLTSDQFSTKVSYNITAKANPTVVLEDIDGEKYKTLEVLVKVFNGINANNLTNMKDIVLNGPNDGNYTITLTVEEDYTINGRPTLTSNPFRMAAEIDIKAKDLTPGEIIATDVDNNAFKSFATLVKLFEFDTSEITEEFLNRVVVVTMNPMIGHMPRKVTLTVNPGYAINGQPTLDSAEFVIPDYLIGTTETVPNDIKPSDITEEKYKEFVVLQKLFTGIGFTNETLNNMNIERIEVVENESYQIKLTPKDNYFINGGVNGITSKAFNVSFENIVISRVETPPNDITIENLNNDTLMQTKEFLSRFFNLGNLTQNQINNLIKVEYRNVEANSYKLILLVKSIDIRINGETTYESDIFRIKVNIIVSQKNPITDPITWFDIAPENLNTLNTVQKVFNIDIDQAMLDDAFKVNYIEFDGISRISLQLRKHPVNENGHYTINGTNGNVLSSVPFHL
ncbi:MAG: hypothetical protein ACRC63_03445, partial [Metamycoplasmataceae bacterium]